MSFEEVLPLENIPDITGQIASNQDFLAMFSSVIYDPVTLIIFVLSFAVIWFVLNKLKGFGAIVAAILIVLFVVLPIIYNLFSGF